MERAMVVLQRCTAIRRSYPEVRDLLLESPTWLHGRVQGGPLPRLGLRLEVGRAICRRAGTRLPLRWKHRWSSQSVEGSLTASSIGPGKTELLILGAYRAGPGLLGRAWDRLALRGRRERELTLLLGRFASHLEEPEPSLETGEVIDLTGDEPQVNLHIPLEDDTRGTSSARSTATRPAAGPRTGRR